MQYSEKATLMITEFDCLKILLVSTCFTISLDLRSKFSSFFNKTWNIGLAFSQFTEQLKYPWNVKEANLYASEETITFNIRSLSA